MQLSALPKARGMVKDTSLSVFGSRSGADKLCPGLTVGALSVVKAKTATTALERQLIETISQVTGHVNRDYHLRS